MLTVKLYSNKRTLETQAVFLEQLSWLCLLSEDMLDAILGIGKEKDTKAMCSLLKH